jgi:hypothetical protein
MNDQMPKSTLDPVQSPPCLIRTVPGAVSA